jgi:hypothetical protein
MKNFLTNAIANWPLILIFGCMVVIAIQFLIGAYSMIFMK